MYIKAIESIVILFIKLCQADNKFSACFDSNLNEFLNYQLI